MPQRNITSRDRQYRSRANAWKSKSLPLFEHVGRRIYLTAAGKEPHQAANEVLERLCELEAALASLRGQVKGPLQSV